MLAAAAVVHGETTTVTTTSTATGTTSGATTTATSENYNDVAKLALLFGFAVIVSLLTYMGIIQKASYKLMGKKSAYRPADVDAFDDAKSMTLGMRSSTVRVDGPASITVGEPAEYRALKADAEVDAEWTVSPAGSATWTPTSGKTVAVTATKADAAYTVTAKAGDEMASKEVKAAAKPDTATTIPFVGKGWGTIVIVVALLTFATVLGLTDSLDKGALATLFGAIAGYAFHHGVTSGGGPTSTSPGTGTQK
jgi:hypothetical protein